MYTIIIDNRSQHEDEGSFPCIYCDWSYCYEDEVKAVAIDLMQKWNASNDECDHASWNEFIEEAIEVVKHYANVETQCDHCNAI
jgi:hypothetical protein